MLKVPSKSLTSNQLKIPFYHLCASYGKKKEKKERKMGELNTLHRFVRGDRGYFS